MPTAKPGIPWWGKLLLATAGIALPIMAILYTLSMASTVRWERYATSLRKTGLPLTFDEIEQQRTRIPTDGNSALLLDSLTDELEEMGEHRWDTDRGVMIFGHDRGGHDLFQGIPRYRAEASREFLAEQGDLLGRLSAFRDLPAGRIDVEVGELAINTLLPQIPPARTAGKLVYLESMMALIDGDVPRAIDATRVLANIAGTLNEHPTVIGRLVQNATDNMVIRAVENTLRTTELDLSALQTLDDVIERRLDQTTMLWALLGERALFLATCEDVAAGKISPMSISSGGGIIGPSLPVIPYFLIRQNQTTGVEMMTRLVEAAGDPGALVDAAAGIEQEVPKLPMTQFIVRTMMPSLSRAVTLHLRLKSELQCARLGLAAERFRIDTGRLPRSIDELVPDYAEEVPTDPFADAPMRFAQTEKGIVFYSVDENGVDDDGNTQLQQKRHNVLDSGFRLFHPAHRGVLLTDEPRPADD